MRQRENDEGEVERRKGNGKLKGEKYPRKIASDN